MIKLKYKPAAFPRNINSKQIQLRSSASNFECENNFDPNRIQNIGKEKSIETSNW